MLKHSYHARLSIWHVVLLVIILAISLPVLAEPVSSTSNPPIAPWTTSQFTPNDRLHWHQAGQTQRAGDELHSA